jgi:hypothetical protein
VNSDGTVSFVPNESIFLAALAAMLLLVVLLLVKGLASRKRKI